MGKASKKKKSNNTNPIQKLSDIVPDPGLVDYDTIPKQVRYSKLRAIARTIARYSKEKKLSKDTKSKIKSLFSREHFFAIIYMHDLFLGIPNLSCDERKRWQNKSADFYDKVKDILFESLDNNVSNLDKFDELIWEEANINLRLAADANTYRGRGTIDKKTRMMKSPEPAKARQEDVKDDLPAGKTKTGKPKGRPPVTKAIKIVLDEYPGLKLEHKPTDLLDKVNQKLKSWEYQNTKYKTVKSTLTRLRKKKK